MTKEEILAMKPGEELDAAVGNEVMGWGRGAWRPFIEISKGYRVSHQFKPSTSLSAAWEVVEKLNLPFFIRRLPGKNYAVGIGYGKGICSGEIAPEAICKAALLAVMEAQL